MDHLFKFTAEALSKGRNRVLYDDFGLPSVMVEVPVTTCRELAPQLDNSLHPAFVVNGRPVKRVFIGKYSDTIIDDHAYSLPLCEPPGCISYDQAMAACRAKGAGWTLVPAALWSALALICQRDGVVLRGNNYYGHDFFHREESGIPAYYEDAHLHKVVAGSGPLSWYHDHSPAGIADLYGNVSEWNAGLRLVRGEIQLIPDSDSILPDVSIAADSPAWRSLLPDGSLAPPGHPDALKFDFRHGAWCISDHITSSVDDTRFCRFHELCYDERVLPQGPPQLLKSLTLFPADDDLSDYGRDYIYINNAQAERILLRGGNFSSANHAGIFYFALDAMRNRCLPRLNFRSAYYELD